MFVIHKGKRYVAFSPLPQPDITYPSKRRLTVESDPTANSVANDCQKMPDATKSIVTKAAGKRRRIGDGANGKTYQLFQSNPSEKG